MNKLCLIFLGALLLALHLASQVQAQTTTVSSRITNATVTWNVTATMRPTIRAFNATLSSNSTTTANVTQDMNGCGRTEVSLVLFPLVLAGFLHGWS